MTFSWWTRSRTWNFAFLGTLLNASWKWTGKDTCCWLARLWTRVTWIWFCVIDPTLQSAIMGQSFFSGLVRRVELSERYFLVSKIGESQECPLTRSTHWEGFYHTFGPALAVEECASVLKTVSSNTLASPKNAGPEFKAWAFFQWYLVRRNKISFVNGRLMDCFLHKLLRFFHVVGSTLGEDKLVRPIRMVFLKLEQLLIFLLANILYKILWKMCRNLLSIDVMRHFSSAKSSRLRSHFLFFPSQGIFCPNNLQISLHW